MGMKKHSDLPEPVPVATIKSRTGCSSQGVPRKSGPPDRATGGSRPRTRICEIIHGEWEMQRLREFKDLIITSARGPALKNLLSIALDASGAADIDDLAERFFTNKGVRKKVGDILRKYGMTEASIDAEAFRHCLVELGEINRRLAELSSRRDKNLQQLEDYRAGLASPTHWREGGAVMIGGDDGD